MGAQKAPWMVSLHGGHSVEYCDHATSTLRDMLEAAVAGGLHTYGVTEHAARIEPRFLYPDEIRMGWDIPKVIGDFEAYAVAIKTLAQEFAGRLEVLCGFESETIPARCYKDLMLGYRERFEFDYMLGSVHYVDEVLVDGWQPDFDRVLAMRGTLDNLAVAYYGEVAQMIEALRPEVVAHFDVVGKFAGPHGPVDTPPIRKAAEAALEAARHYGCILDLNTGAYLKRGVFYPAPWIVRMAERMGIPFCFGDDSHSIEGVGAAFDQARAYLLENGVSTVTFLAREGKALTRKTARLEGSLVT